MVSVPYYLYGMSLFFTDEWTNFLERVERKSEEELKESIEMEDQLRLWASYRGQTLTKTGRGVILLLVNLIMLMLYYS